MDLSFIRPAERGTIPNQISHLSWELTSLLRHDIVSVGLASEGDDDVAADAGQKVGAMYEAEQLSQDQAIAYNSR